MTKEVIDILVLIMYAIFPLGEFIFAWCPTKGPRHLHPRRFKSLLPAAICKRTW